MDDLFEQLKTTPSVNKYVSSGPLPGIKKTKDGDFKSNTCLSPRRESMPPPSSAIVFKKPANKSRSMSPPKVLLAGVTKPFKVLIERKKLEDFLAMGEKKKNQQQKKKTPSVTPSPPQSPQRKEQPQKRRTSYNSSCSDYAVAEVSPTKNNAKSLTGKSTSIKTPLKVTPTKAQQKLFDPAVLKKAQQLKQFKIKRCRVRIQRNNLKKLQKHWAKIKAEQKEKKNNKSKKVENVSPPKRKTNSIVDSSSPAKRGRPGIESKIQKPTGGFFIKLTTSPSTSLNRKNEHNKIKKFPVRDFKAAAKEKSTKKQIAQQQSKSTTKPTKFTRTQLIKSFGKRYFRSHVKIERCTHPLMLTFESNARARKLKAKRNKSKNLSVSFRDQVEIFGDTDSDSDSSGDDPSFAVNASTSQSASNKTNSSNTATPTPLLVTPARLKKVENGKVVDDIEFDTSLFIDPKSANSSTPFVTPGRKKREKKSFSPLKGDGTPSPRKEQLKLANEKLPPSGLRRLNIDDADDDDDEDDDCEYIVPIDIPSRRTSCASSTNIADLSITTSAAEPQTKAVESSKKEDSTSADQQPSTTITEIPIENEDNLSIDKNLVLNESPVCKAETEGQKTTTEITDALNSVTKSTTTVTDENHATIELPKLTRIEASPTLSLNTLKELVESVVNNSDENNGTNTDKDNNDQNSLVADNVEAQLDDDDISLRLYVEADTDNVSHGSPYLAESAIQDSQIIDNIVNETINDLAKHILEKDTENAALAESEDKVQPVPEVKASE